MGEPTDRHRFRREPKERLPQRGEPTDRHRLRREPTDSRPQSDELVIRHIHFIGIAGSGMSGLSLLAKALGYTVTGSDLQESRYLEAVLEAGIEVSMPQSAANVDDPGIDVVVVSSAIKPDNPELLAAEARGLPIWPRARMLAWLGRNSRTLAVAGTHGKTTTSAMLASTLAGLEADPSFVIGGILKQFQSSAHLGTGPDFVIEADESDESFTWLKPQLIIITNIEPDHMDHFGSQEEINAAFRRFIDTLTPGGLLLYCADDSGLAELVGSSGVPAVSYGFAESADYRCVADGSSGFSVQGPAGQVDLEIGAAPGVHNMLNATAVLAAAAWLGFDLAIAAQALQDYQGVKRRFDLVGEALGVRVIDDYGHHPTEIKATLAAARRLGYRRLHLIFQPHRYSRTYRLFDDFVEAFGETDSLFILDIYSAGEKSIDGVSSQALVAAINTKHPDRRAQLADRATAVESVIAAAGEGDLIICMGAGDVTALAPVVLAELKDAAEREAVLAEVPAEPVEEEGGGGDAPGGGDASAGNGVPTGDGSDAPTSNDAPSAAPVLSTLKQPATRNPKSRATSGDLWKAPIFEAYCELEGSIRGSLLMNEPMARHTSFRIGGPAALYIECASLADLKTALAVIERYRLPWAPIGKGTNLLVSDQGFEGAIVTLGKEFRSYSFPTLDADDADQDGGLEPGDVDGPPTMRIVAGAGVVLGNLVRNAFKLGYSGLEFAVGIPGTLGGALFMNAGGATEWISEAVSSVLVLRGNDGLARYAADDLNWKYRSSGLPLGEIILEAELIVRQGNAGYIKARMEAAMRRRQKTQPLNIPNAGSVFRNPEGESAGQLIESLGLKGLSKGGASVSDLHANFIVNQGSASAQDVIDLIQEIRNRVRQSYGFELQTEIRFIGFT